MRIFQGTFETRKRSFIGAFSSCIMVPLTLINRSPYDIETNQSKSKDWFLYDRDLRHERVKAN